jgi:hypothetical protein
MHALYQVNTAENQEGQMALCKYLSHGISPKFEIGL